MKIKGETSLNTAEFEQPLAIIVEVPANGTYEAKQNSKDIKTEIAVTTENKAMPKPLADREFNIVEKIDVRTAEKSFNEQKLSSYVETVQAKFHQKPKYKAIVNIDTLSENYEEGETVNIQSLRSKCIISKKADYVKVLGRGVLDKPLIVEADDFTINAIKMILLTGGRVIQTV